MKRELQAPTPCSSLLATLSSQCSEMGHSARPLAPPCGGCPLGTPVLHLLVGREGIGGCALRRPQGLFAGRCAHTDPKKVSQGIDGSVGRCAVRCTQMAKVELRRSVFLRSWRGTLKWRIISSVGQTL